MSDLGISAGTTISGYFLMAYDVTNGGSMNQPGELEQRHLLSTNTDGSTGNGGIDLSAVNGVVYNRVVPEPSTSGAMFIGLTAAFVGWRRHRRNPSVAAA